MFSIKKFISGLMPGREKARVYVDSRSFDPCRPRRGESVVLFARNEAGSIYERVTGALRSAAGVVVIDENSSDGTSFFAAEAGAVVVMQAPGQPREASLAEALRLARRMTPNVRVIE